MKKLSLTFYTSRSLIRTGSFLVLNFLCACGIHPGEDFLLQTTPASSLYVASGACYAGGVATDTGLGLITQYDLSTGAQLSTVYNYMNNSPNDLPVGLISYDSNDFMTLIENANGRRIDLVPVAPGGSLRNFYLNAAALSTNLRSVTASQDGSYFVTKANAIEKISANRQRITIAGNPFINAPAGGCANSNTAMTSVLEMPQGKLLYSHAAATPNNKLGLISKTGYAAAADCLASQAAPNTTALPTAMVYHPSGTILVAYGSVTSLSNFIYAYTVNETTNTISAGTLAYQNLSYVNGPSAMAVDPASGDIFIANAIQGGESIERFSFNASTQTLTRKTSTSFIQGSQTIRCVSGLSVID